jgi:hypothetical protein
MRKLNPRINVCCVLLAMAGAVFVVTAFAYALMSFQLVHASVPALELYGQHPLWRLLRGYGNWILGGELSLLAILVFAAIACDQRDP